MKLYMFFFFILSYESDEFHEKKTFQTLRISNIYVLARICCTPIIYENDLNMRQTWNLNN